MEAADRGEKKRKKVEHPSLGRRKHFLRHVASLSHKRNRWQIVLQNVTEVSDCCSSAWTHHDLAPPPGWGFGKGARRAQKHEPIKVVSVAVKLDTRQPELRRERWKSLQKERSLFSCVGQFLLDAQRDESWLAAPLISAIYTSGKILPPVRGGGGCFHTAGGGVGGQEVFRIFRPAPFLLLPSIWVHLLS